MVPRPESPCCCTVNMHMETESQETKAQTKGLKYTRAMRKNVQVARTGAVSLAPIFTESLRLEKIFTIMESNC